MILSVILFYLNLSADNSALTSQAQEVLSNSFSQSLLMVPVARICWKCFVLTIVRIRLEEKKKAVYSGKVVVLLVQLAEAVTLGLHAFFHFFQFSIIH